VRVSLHVSLIVSRIVSLIVCLSLCLTAELEAKRLALFMKKKKGKDKKKDATNAYNQDPTQMDEENDDIAGVVERLTDMHTKYPKHGVMHCNFALPDRDTITSQILPAAVELRSDRLKFPLLLAKYKEMNKGTPWAEGSEPPTPGRSQRITRPLTLYPGMLVDTRPV
jgi:hypothetical protein